MLFVTKTFNLVSKRVYLLLFSDMKEQKSPLQRAIFIFFVTLMIGFIEKYY